MGAALASPEVISALIGVAGGIGQSLMAPNPQQLESFSGSGPTTDPESLLDMGTRAITTYGNAIIDRANQPITLRSSYVQPVPGTTGVDPGYTDRSLLTAPGANLPHLFPDFPVGKGLAATGFSHFRQRPPGAETTGQAMPRPGGPIPKGTPRDQVGEIMAGRGVPARTPPAGAPTTGTATRKALPNPLGTPTADPAHADPSASTLQPERSLTARIGAMVGQNQPSEADRATAAVQLLMHAYGMA
jgi:hypothetical protein